MLLTAGFMIAISCTIASTFGQDTVTNTTISPLDQVYVCKWGNCSFLNYHLTNCFKDHRYCPLRNDTANETFCCKTDCCTEEKYMGNRCEYENKCTLSEGVLGFCCDHGCCTYHQYYGHYSGSCDNDRKYCPGRSDNASKTFCCLYKCCDEDEFNNMQCFKGSDCENQTSTNEQGDIIKSNRCCQWGCCSNDQYYMRSWRSTCESHDQCPGRKNNKYEKFCCKFKCCTEEEFNNRSFCFYNSDCDKGQYCCKWGCCSEEQYNTTPCTTHSQCPSRLSEKEKTFCCGRYCCTDEQYNDLSCPGFNCTFKSFEENDKFKCCDWGCCTYKQYDSYSAYCSSREHCPSRSSNVNETYCCDNRCCTEAMYNQTSCVYSWDCPMLFDSEDKTYCCNRSKCCTYNEYYKRSSKSSTPKYLSTGAIVGYVLAGLSALFSCCSLICKCCAIKESEREENAVHGSTDNPASVQQTELTEPFGKLPPSYEEVTKQSNDNQL